MPNNTKNNQWRKVERIAIRRAKRIAKNLERLMFVIYDNEEEQYDIVSEEQLDNLTTINKNLVDFDFITEVS